jgi:hypothetical protein
MKKIIILFLFIANAITVCFAKDIILKTNGEEIEATVLEVKQNEVLYKYIDIESSAVYTIPISEVFMITYENGSKDLFNKYQSLTARTKQSDVGIVQLSREFYTIGTNDSLMLKYLRKYDPTYNQTFYNAFFSACRARNTGSALLGIGLTSSLFGMVIMIYGGLQSDSFFYSMGIIVGLAGEVFTIISIPVSASAGARKQAIKNNFKNLYLIKDNYSYIPTLNFGLTNNGIGLTLNF